MNQGETVKIFAGDANMEEVKSFCNRERAVPQVCTSIAAVAGIKRQVKIRHCTVL